MTARGEVTWRVLDDHFGADQVNAIASSRRRFAGHLRPDLQDTITIQLASFAPRLLGVHQAWEHNPLTIAQLTIRNEKELVAITPLQYQDIDTGEADPFAALNTGLWLFYIGATPAALLISQYNDHFGESRIAQVEIAYLPTDEAASFAMGFLRKLQEAGSTSRLYRGKVLSFEAGSDYSGMKAELQVHKLPYVDQSEVILSDEAMARLDQHVFDFDRHRQELKRLGQSTRKGILLYGPPGTGKTHVIRYVASRLSEHTTVLITAEQVRNLSKYMTLARTLQPSIVVLEDIDLVGRSREQMGSDSTEILLNRLLNEMDGLRSDADILFILTTNRPDDIEEALASRPGRIDEAIEISLPDDNCRRRLLSLYGRDLDFADGAISEAVSRSGGASAAFVKEMVRRLAQRSLMRDGSNLIFASDVEVVFGDAAARQSRISRRIVGLEGEPRERRRGDCC